VSDLGQTHMPNPQIHSLTASIHCWWLTNALFNKGEILIKFDSLLFKQRLLGWY
jgi:hypothetical protein